MNYAKVILTAYPYLDDAILNMEKQIDKRCKLSFYSSKPCQDYAEKIANLIESKQKLVDLKDKITLVLSRLDGLDLSLIKYKYFNNGLIGDFNCSLRQYFRMQKKAIESFSELLSFINITEDYFIKNYADIPYIKSIMIKEDCLISA